MTTHAHRAHDRHEPKGEIAVSNYERTTTEKITETVRLSGPIRPMPYSRDGKQYRVDMVIAEWHRHNGGDWCPMTPSLRGQVLRKDGSDSKNRTDERAWPKATPEDEWLTMLLATLTPTPDPRATAREDGGES